MIRENSAMVLNAAVVDRRNMTCDLDAAVVPTAVPVPSEARVEKIERIKKRVRV